LVLRLFLCKDLKHYKNLITNGGEGMKTIGLLGGTGWSSTIGYYKTLNEMVNQRLGGYHSAKIVLKSIDYHEIMSNYGKDHEKVAQLLQEELSGLIALNPDCLIICCNSLHKYYDIIKNRLHSSIPVMHAVDLVAHHCQKQKYKKILLLATRFTMEDGFFEEKLKKSDIDAIIPNQAERMEMERIHNELMKDVVTQESRNYFSNLILKHKKLDAVVLGCTEYPLVVDPSNSALPIIDPVFLQAEAAVDFSLKSTSASLP
jgi:aspartate racemase